MLIIRPISHNDLNGLMELLEESGFGLTSLPKDPEVLLRRIEHSEHSFAIKRRSKPNGEDFLFVMEDIFKGKIVGVCGIISKIGGFDPSYFYQLKEESLSSSMLKVKNKIHSMHVHKVHSGPAEICSLFLASDYRNAQNGRLLSLSRFLFIAENKECFEQEIIAEMRGKVDDSGHSPFWEAVGAKFFKIDFPEADYLYMKSKKFIEELLPKHPLIVELLPKEAQEVVAKVHPNTEPAKKILEQEGFHVSDLVGIFEPGPVLKAVVDEIRTIVKSKLVVVKDIKDTLDSSEKFIIAKPGKSIFKSCLGSIREHNDGTIDITSVTATALKIRVGDSVRYVNLKS